MWVRVDDSLPIQRKTYVLAELLGIELYATAGLVLLLWLWSAMNTKDGNLWGYSHRAIADACKWDKDPTELLSALIKSGFVSENMQVEDWYEVAGKQQEAIVANRMRNRDYRARKRGSLAKSAAESTQEERHNRSSVSASSDSHERIASASSESEANITSESSGVIERITSASSDIHERIASASSENEAIITSESSGVIERITSTSSDIHERITSASSDDSIPVQKESSTHQESGLNEKQDIAKVSAGRQFSSESNLDDSNPDDTCSQSTESGAITQEQLFDLFWDAYPKNISENAARRAFSAIDPDGVLVNLMLDAIKRETSSGKWNKENGRSIPNPATWLKQRLWVTETHEPESKSSFAQMSVWDFNGEDSSAF